MAEDGVLLRERLTRLLGEAGFEVVGQCTTAEELLLKVRSHSADVAIPGWAPPLDCSSPSS